MPTFELPYHHFSVVVNARRKMAFFTAVNIDGTLEQDLGKRENDKWILKTSIHNLEGAGRFVIGLAADIKIVEGEALQDYILDYQKRYIQKL